MDGTPLTHWDNFYVIVGSSAAALTGLQFVVMALAADSPTRTGTSTATVDAFGTPNVVHFSMVLLLSSILSAPWPTLFSMMIPLTLCGIGGIVYGIIVVRRARCQTGYTPVLEDWIWHTVLPIAAYTALTAASLMLIPVEEDALFAIGGESLLLLFIGIHNAWDTVTYLAAMRVERQDSLPADATGESGRAGRDQH
jgi:hypothetical protein